MSKKSKYLVIVALFLLAAIVFVFLFHFDLQTIKSITGQPNSPISIIRTMLIGVAVPFFIILVFQYLEKGFQKAEDKEISSN